MVLSGEIVAAMPLNATSCSSGQDINEGGGQSECAAVASGAASRPVAISD